MIKKQPICTLHVGYREPLRIFLCFLSRGKSWSKTRKLGSNWGVVFLFKTEFCLARNVEGTGMSLHIKSLSSTMNCCWDQKAQKMKILGQDSVADEIEGFGSPSPKVELIWNFGLLSFYVSATNPESFIEIWATHWTTLVAALVQWLLGEGPQAKIKKISFSSKMYRVIAQST